MQIVKFLCNPRTISSHSREQRFNTSQQIRQTIITRSLRASCENAYPNKSLSLYIYIKSYRLNKNTSGSAGLMTNNTYIMYTQQMRAMHHVLWRAGFCISEGKYLFINIYSPVGAEQSWQFRSHAVHHTPRD